jgi:hypothetical protein
VMTSTCGVFLVLGVDPFGGVRCTGFVDGDCLWDLSLGHRTGDGKFDGETVWVGCGWFFLVPFYVIYYILISGGFPATSSDHHEGDPGPPRPVKTRVMFKFRRPDDLFHVLNSEGTSAPRSTTDSMDRWVWCLLHMWSTLHVISVICLV